MDGYTYKQRVLTTTSMRFQAELLLRSQSPGSMYGVRIADSNRRRSLKDPTCISADRPSGQRNNNIGDAEFNGLLVR